MKLTINKKAFLQSWNLAERGSSPSGSMSILSSVLIKASDTSVTLQATDIRTSIICLASGVTVVEPGETVFPIKIVGDLFKKAPGEEFTITVDEGKAVLKSGRSKYNFSTYPSNEFPEIPSSDKADVFCSVAAKDLLKVIEEGTIAASTGEEYPQYLSSANFELNDSVLNIVSTDNRRLAKSGILVQEASNENSALLPMKGIKEVQRILSSMNPDSLVNILYDNAQFYFKTETLEFTIRRGESKFPSYEKIIPKGSTTSLTIDRGYLMSALERVDVIVRDYSKMVVLEIKEGCGVLMRGKAPDFGQAKEEVDAKVQGESLKIAFNSKFFMEALKVMRESEIRLAFNGNFGHMQITRVDDKDFICLIAPINLSQEELNSENEENEDE